MRVWRNICIPHEGQYEVCEGKRIQKEGRLTIDSDEEIQLPMDAPGPRFTRRHAALLQKPDRFSFVNSLTIDPLTYPSESLFEIITAIASQLLHMTIGSRSTRTEPTGYVEVPINSDGYRQRQEFYM